MATWPSTLPQAPLQNASYAPAVDNVITSNMETGAPKTRRRFTFVPETFTGSLLLTTAQVATLKTFVATTVKDVLPFTWKHFQNGSAQNYVFTKRPTYTYLTDSGGYWTAEIELRTTP